MEKANFIILLFILNDVIVTDVNVTGSDVIDPFYFYCIAQTLLNHLYLFVIMVHVVTEPCGY